MRRGPEVAPGVRRMPLARVEYMLGLDVTESPESDAMVDAPAEAPVRTGAEIAGDGDVAESSEGDAMVDAPTDRFACCPGAARKKPKKNADRELEDCPPHQINPHTGKWFCLKTVGWEQL